MPEKELERQIHKHKKTAEELEIRIESLNRHIKELFAELNVTPEQVNAFISNKEHFTEDNWATLCQQLKTLEAQLERELANIRNPKQTQKALTDRRIQPHWLFVR